jgi:hypothetical protein
MARTLTQWVKLLSDYDLTWYWSIEDLVDLHRELHKEYGDDPNEAIIEGEQHLSNILRGYGVEHRYDDALSVKAGTKIDNPASPTVNEIRAYLKELTLQNGAIQLVKTVDTEDSTLYVKSSDVLPVSMSKTILRMMNRRMPPGIQLKALPLTSKGEFAEVSNVMDLRLMSAWGSPMVTTWASLTVALRVSAAKASPVFKETEDPMLPFTVVKSEIAPQGDYVLGIVLEPDKLDNTKLDPKQVAKTGVSKDQVQETGAVGDIYDEVAVREAFEWFCEFGQQFECEHEIYGGELLAKGDIVLFDNYTAPCEMTFGDQIVAKGTWLAGARINKPELKQKIIDGELNTWSIFARAMGRFEEIEVPI